jgi:acyl-homoserine-lactone acylase
VVTRCKAGGEAVAEACGVLERWNGRFDVDSRGAVLWRELTAALSPREPVNAGSFFSVPFDPAQPIATPNTLTPAPATGTDPVVTALQAAVARLAQGGVAPDATLGEAQYHPRGSQRFALHGGLGRDGVANVVTYRNSKSSVDPSTPRGTVIDPANNPTGISTQGYVVNYGTSFLMAMEFTDAGPRGEAFLTYGESEDPASPFLSDQLALFSAKSWRPIKFTDADIAADPARTEKNIQGN